jgi:endonuclease/exonuclease/phosphatase family metal-dependent hydrolase
LTSRWVTLFFAILTLMAISAYYISPLHAWPFALLGLVFPLLAVIMFIFLVIWIIRKRWFALLPLLVLTIGFPQLRSMAAWRLQPKEVTEISPSIKIMTYNVRNFDLYNWSNNLRSKAIIYDMLREEDPDVICFQEFYSDTTRDFNNIEQLRAMGYRYYAFAEELTLRGQNQWGIATFSKFPITDTMKILRSRFSTGYGFFPYKGVYTTIQFNNTAFGLYNVHLQSVHFAEQDYETIKEAAEEQNIDWIEGKSIVGKMVKAYRRRALQTEELIGLLKKDPSKPTIIASDLNDTPSSHAYNKVRGKMQDAFLIAGKGIGATYNGPVPGLRIDFLFHTTDILALQAKVVDNSISDHKPLVGIFHIPQ